MKMAGGGGGGVRGVEEGGSSGAVAEMEMRLKGKEEECAKLIGQVGKLKEVMWRGGWVGVVVDDGVVLVFFVRACVCVKTGGEGARERGRESAGVGDVCMVLACVVCVCVSR